MIEREKMSLWAITEKGKTAVRRRNKKTMSIWANPRDFIHERLLRGLDFRSDNGPVKESLWDYWVNDILSLFPHLMVKQTFPCTNLLTHTC
ncbi:hypothetical protein Hanom_Chr11g01002961 [Helianthus anomalus]